MSQKLVSAASIENSDPFFENLPNGKCALFTVGSQKFKIKLLRTIFQY